MTRRLLRISVVMCTLALTGCGQPGPGGSSAVDDTANSVQIVAPSLTAKYEIGDTIAIPFVLRNASDRPVLVPHQGAYWRVARITVTVPSGLTFVYDHAPTLRVGRPSRPGDYRELQPGSKTTMYTIQGQAGRPSPSISHWQAYDRHNDGTRVPFCKIGEYKIAFSYEDRPAAVQGAVKSLPGVSVGLRVVEKK